MNPDGATQQGLVPVGPVELARAGARSLTARGRADLRRREEAEEWLRKGLELRESAPTIPKDGPRSPNACPPTPEDLIRTVIPTYIEQVSAGVLPETLRKRDQMLIQAFHCFEKGHELDSWNAQLLYYLADSYYRGCGVREDKEIAAAFFRRAADQGHSNAQYCLGVLYGNGEGINPDEVEAARWLRQAAEQGNVDAQISLGVAYKTGTGVPQDYAQGVMWLRRAGEMEDFGDPAPAADKR